MSKTNTSATNMRECIEPIVTGIVLLALIATVGLTQTEGCSDECPPCAVASE